MPPPRPPLRRRPIRPLDDQIRLAARGSRGLAASPWSRAEMGLIMAGLRRPPPRDRLPDFLGIGTPQSGTTWLFD